MAGRIEDYALIGDLRTAALIGRDGSVDWLCLPRFDSPSCFAGLLGGPGHGAWRLAPAGAVVCRARRHRGDSLVLESEWHTADGRVRVTDFMPPRGPDGRRAPQLVRVVDGLTGSIPMRGELRLRFNYGRVNPWVRRTDHHRVAVAGPDSAWLRVPDGVHTYGLDGATTSEFTVTAGQRVPFVLTWQPSHLATTPRTDPDRALLDTVSRWQHWAAGCRYQGEWRAAVLLSLITLKALAYAPTGGIVAAPTASPPERIGGARTWDYRFCWLRDFSMTLAALLRSRFREEAVAWRRWLLRAIAGDPGDLQAVYGVVGERSSARPPPTDCPATRTRGRCGSATPPSASSNSTSTARRWTPCTSHCRPGCRWSGTCGRCCGRSWPTWNSTGANPTRGCTEPDGPGPA